MRALKKPHGLALAKTIGNMAEEKLYFLQQAVIPRIFPTSFQQILGKHPKENQKNQHPLQRGNSKASERKIDNGKAESGKQKMTVQGIRSVSSVHKTQKRYAKAGKKAHLLLLPPETSANSLRN